MSALQRNAACNVFAAPLAVRCGAGTQPQDQPSPTDPLHARCRGGQHGGMAVGDVGHQRAQTDRGRRHGQRAEQREALEHRPVALDHLAVEVIEHPRGVVSVGLGVHDGVAERRPVVGAGAELNVDLHAAPGRCCHRSSAVLTVRAEGLEPTLLAEQGPKPCASASFATPAARPSRYRPRHFGGDRLSVERTAIGGRRRDGRDFRWRRRCRVTCGTWRRQPGR